MNAAVKKDYRTALYTPNITKPAVISAFLHVTVFVLATVGIPYLSKDIVTEDMVIPVELFDPSEIIETTNSDEPQKSEEEDIAPPPERKPVYNNSETVPDLAVPQEPDIPEPEEIIPEETPKVEPPDPTEIKKPPKPKSKPKPPQKPKVAEEKPKEEEKPEKDITSLLKDLMPDEQEKTDSNSEQGEGQGQSSQIADYSQQMTGYELSQLNAGVSPCWFVDIGSAQSRAHIVPLKVFVNPDLTVRKVEIIEKARYASDSHYKIYAESARRALLHPNCNKLRIPLEKYEYYKVFKYTFDPSNML